MKRADILEFLKFYGIAFVIVYFSTNRSATFSENELIVLMFMALVYTPFIYLGYNSFIKKHDSKTET